MNKTRDKKHCDSGTHEAVRCDSIRKLWYHNFLRWQYVVVRSPTTHPMMVFSTRFRKMIKMGSIIKKKNIVYTLCQAVHSLYRQLTFLKHVILLLLENPFIRLHPSTSKAKNTRNSCIIICNYLNLNSSLPHQTLLTRLLFTY